MNYRYSVGKTLVDLTLTHNNDKFDIAVKSTGRVDRCYLSKEVNLKHIPIPNEFYDIKSIVKVMSIAIGIVLFVSCLLLVPSAIYIIQHFHELFMVSLVFPLIIPVGGGLLTYNLLHDAYLVHLEKKYGYYLKIEKFEPVKIDKEVYDRFEEFINQD